MAQVSILAGGAPVASDVLVTADQETIFGSGTAQDPLHTGDGGGTVFNAICESAPVTIGMAVATSLSTAPRSSRPAAGNAAVQVWGIAKSSAGLDEAFKIQQTGVVTLTSDQWLAVTGTATLSKGTTYYVSQSTPGHLTITGPTTGQFSHVVGVGIGPLDLLLIPSPTTIAP